MGTWSNKPFGNDTARDWAWRLKGPSGTKLLSSTIEAALKQRTEIEATIAEECVAAASVIASATDEPIRGVSAQIRSWVRVQGYVPTKKLIRDTIRAIECVMDDSELRDLWQESDGLESWLKATAKVREKLVAAQRSDLPQRRPRKLGVPRSLHKLLERYDADQSVEVLARIKKKVRSLEDPNAGIRETQYREPLVLIAERGLMDEVLFLLEQGADPSGGTSLLSGVPPFVAACARGHLDVAEVLREAGADVFSEVEHSPGEGLLGDVVLDQMDVYGIAPKEKGYRFCLALFVAARSGSPETVDYLIGLGADLGQSDLNGETLLHKAAEGNNVPMIEYLLDAGLDVNARKGKHAETVLHYAVQSNSFDCADLLLDRGADPNLIESFQGSVDHWQNTPLDIAAAKRSKKMAALLRKHGGMLASDLTAS